MSVSRVVLPVPGDVRFGRAAFGSHASGADHAGGVSVALPQPLPLGAWDEGLSKESGRFFFSLLPPP